MASNPFWKGHNPPYEPEEKVRNQMKTFKSGATRDTSVDKLDFEGFLSPLALKRYAEYLHKHRIQADGKMRDSDNWQKGIPVDTYMKSMFRHLIDVWTIHRGHIAEDQRDSHIIELEEALSAVIFNAFGYLHEVLIDNGTPPFPAEAATDVPAVPSKCKDCMYLNSKRTCGLFLSQETCHVHRTRCMATRSEDCTCELVRTTEGICKKTSGNKNLVFGLPPEDVPDYSHGEN